MHKTNMIYRMAICGMALVMLAGCRHPQQERAAELSSPIREETEPIEVPPNMISEVRRPDMKIHVKRGQALLMQTEGLTLTAVDAAVQREADYSVTSLVGEELPPLPQGMMNMTAATAGYRLLPGGEHFQPYAELRVSYDPGRLPQGYTPYDIYTSFYDTAALAWVRLERVGVDTVNHEIVSLTTHFTDFVNELLKAPEMPETQAFVPTAMSDLEAVSPTDGLTMIQPPAANNNGTANLSYPLEIPAGRGGMQPNLALTYSSTGGSGWLGVGWDIPVSSITVDTRWGVPRYNAGKETEIYLLDGEQLITKKNDSTPRAMPHRTNQQTNRLPEGTQFYARTGDAHDSIIRHGDSPKNYWWEVVDRNGVTHYYGRYHQPSRCVDISPSYDVIKDALPSDVSYDSLNNILHWPLPTTLCDDEENIARWVLSESRDPYGNTVRYYYDRATVRNRGAVGRQLYLDSISYTGHNDTDGYYTVVFCRTGNITPDVPEACNNGFKEVTDQLLNNVYLKCGDNIQTIWHFEMENGDSTNYKNRLAGVTKIDSVGDMDMRGLIDTMCHCIRQDEDEFATAGADSVYVFIPDSILLVMDTIYAPKYRIIEEKPDLSPEVLHSSGDIPLYQYVQNNMCPPICSDSLFYAILDSVYYQATYYNAEGNRCYRYMDGYEARVDTIKVLVFDSLSTPHHIRPLSGFDSLGYAAATTTFEYYDAPGSETLFGDEKTIHPNSENLHGFFLSDPLNANHATRLRSRATGLGLSTSSNWNVGGAATVGLGPVVCLTSASLGGNYTRSGSSSETKMTLVDLDGDGLNDKVYVRGNRLYYCRQYWNERDYTFHFGEPKAVRGIHHIMQSNSSSNTFGVQAALYASASASWTDTKSTTTSYFADVNADGLVDLVDGGQVYFNHCAKDSVPVFLRYSTVPVSNPSEEEADVIAIVESMDTACGEIIFDGAADDSIKCRRVWVLIDTYTTNISDTNIYTWLNEHSSDTMYGVSEENERLKVEVYHRELDCSYHDESPATDAVRVWIAPRYGTVDITSKIQLIEDTTPSRSVARHADGVVLSIQKTEKISHGQNRFYSGSINTHLTDILLADTDYTMHADIGRRVSVDSGDMIFFRLRSKADYHFDDVHTHFIIDYTDSSKYFGEKYRWHFDSQKDFVLSGSSYFQAPVDGRCEVRLFWNDNHENATAEVFLNDNLFGSTTSRDTLFDGYLGKGDNIYVALSSDNDDVKWGDVVCRPYIVFYPAPDAELYDTIDTVRMVIDTSRFTANAEGWLAPRVQLHHAYGIYNTPLYQRLFGPLHKGWGQFAYRSEGDDADLILVEKLVPPDMMVAGSTNAADSSAMGQMTGEGAGPDTASFGRSETFEDFQTDNPDFYNPYSSSSSWVAMNPDAEHWVWVGYGHQNTVGRDTVSNSVRSDWYCSAPGDSAYGTDGSDEPEACMTTQTIVHDDPVPPAYRGTPAKAVNKVNRSKSHSWSVGFLHQGYSLSNGDNTIEVDYMDLNGDRYPDIIGTDMVQYSQQWGGVGPVAELKNDLSHGSTSHTLSRGLSFSASPVTQERTICGLQQNAFFTMHSEGSGSLSGGGNIGRDKADGCWVDINGDGLPDYVRSDGRVQMNIGYGFIDDSRWDLSNVRDGVSGAISVGAGLQGMQEESVTDFLSGVTNISQASIEAGVGVDGSYNQTTHMLMDINGDGLPDKLWREINHIDSIVSGGDFVKTKVRYNLGAGRFSGMEVLDIGRYHSSASFSESLNLGLTYGFTAFGSFKITAGLNGCPYSAGVTQDYVQLADINADGLPDWVYSIKEDEMIVRYNMGGRTNLLRGVTNFSGAHFQIEYALSEPDYDQPSRSWLMTKVTTHDSLNSHNGATTTVTEYAYSNPHYDRYERTSYGYETVVTSNVDPATASVYRTVERNYYNGNMLRRGKLRREMTRDSNGNPYIERLHNCSYVDYTSGDTLNADTRCPKICYPAVEASLTHFYEGHGTPQLTTGERTEYDRYHNVVRYTDLGDISDAGDGLVVDFRYYTGLANNLIGLRQDYTVTPSGSATAMRRARFEYDFAHGKMTRQVLYNGSDSSVYDFVYEPTYGNLDTAMQPPNDSGQRMTYHYEYDDVTHTYPTRIFNSYGESMSTTYDYRFGKPLTITDPTGSTMTYRYDFAGRLVSVNSPLNNGGTPSLVNEYHPMNYYHNSLNPQGYTFNKSPTHHPYSVSMHYDDNGSLITATAVLTNGYGQAIQTKKGLRVGSADKMQVSGRVVVDAFGRTVEQYDPVTEPRTSHWGKYDTGYSAASLTTTAYDVLDRTTSTVCPLNVTTQAAYSIGNDQGGHRRFVTTTTDPNGNVTTQYADYEGRKVQVTDAAGGITRMHYDNLGQLDSVFDPEGFATTYCYDMLGRMTRRIHPDAGTTHYAYDNAGNLLEEINPLGQINYDYTYYRLLKKRYSNMTGNDVTYTYGTSGTATGRPVRITDGSGMYQCQYDALGNVTEETRTIALPQLPEVYRFRTAYRYDSWGRMLSMTYPDSEEVDYSYQWGGDLYSMHGIKGDNHRVYVSKILYDTLGQRSQVEYGNQTKAYYTYDALHRLTNLQSRNGSGTLMQDISYTFDSASNVTRIANSAGVVNSLGGGYANAYRYDALHRLVWSSGSGDMGSYSMDMGYTPSGRIGRKNRSAHTETLPESVGAVYGYCDQHQPHAVRRIFDADNGTLHDLRWDGAGNLGQISTAHEGPLFESGRFLFWTEDSRMHSAVDDKYHSYYTYDHGGERRLKLTGTNNVVDVNADHMSTHSVLDSPTLYPSAYMVVTSKGYTKHYYAGAERVAARIGGGWSEGPVPLAGSDDSLSAKAGLLYTQSLGQTNGRVLEENDPDCVYGALVESEGLNAQIEEIPSRLQAVAEADYGTFTQAMHRLVEGGPGGLERDVYFYHSDHLGSASWITDSGGQAIQHLQYLPYGEPYVNQRTSGYSERFTFTGKERDSETGYGYFGARYMDHELMTMWLSVDPMADKYPSISPYAYCAWNPVKLVDPDGREMGDYYDENGNYKGWDGVFDHRVYMVGTNTTLAKDENGNVDASKVTPLVSTTYETLEAIVGVFERTKKNGGSIEESTAVLAGLISIPGEHGYTGSDGNPHCNFPSLKGGKQGLGVTSIHSHPFTLLGEDGYHPVTPSEDDKIFFNKCVLNIIVGNITVPQTSSIYPNSTDNIGAAFFSSTGDKLLTMSMRSIERVVNNRHKARDKHWNQIKKRP